LIQLHAKLTKLFTKLIACPARLKPKYLCVLIVKLM